MDLGSRVRDSGFGVKGSRVKGFRVGFKGSRAQGSGRYSGEKYLYRSHAHLWLGCINTRQLVV